MIRHMQQGILAYFFIAMLILAAFSLVLTDWTGTFTAGQGGGNIADMKGDRITAPEFAALVSRVAQNENINPADVYERGLVSQILTSEIWKRLLALNARDLGVRVDDATLLLRLKDMASGLGAGVGPNHKPDAAAIFKQYIQNQGLTEVEFLEILRRDLGNDVVRRVVSGGAGVSPLIVNDLIAYENQKRTIDYVVLNDSDINVPAPTDVQIQKYYEARKNDFMIAEQRDIDIAILSRADISKTIKIAESDARKYADENPDILKVNEKRTVDYTVFQNETDARAAVVGLTGTPDFKKTIQQKFPNLAIDRDDFEKSSSMPAYLEPVFKAAVGDVVGPIQTPLGVFVMRVAAVMPAGARSFENARADIDKILIDEKLGERMDQIMDDLTASSERGDILDRVLKDQPLTRRTVGLVGRNGMRGDGVDAFQDLVDVKSPLLTAAFTTPDVGRILSPVELQNGDVGVVQVKSITPARPKDLKDIKAGLVVDYLNDARRDQNISNAQSALTDWISKKTDLTGIARARNMTVQSVVNVMRAQKELPKPLDRVSWSRLFNASSEVPMMEPISGGVMMAVVRSVQLGDAATAPSNVRADVIAQHTRAQGEEQMVGYMGALSDRYAPRVNDRLVKRIFDRSGAAGE